MSSNKEILLVNRPNDRKIGSHLFETREQAIPSPGEGEILIKQTYMSLDPAMLGWMSEDRESYIRLLSLEKSCAQAVWVK